jgi:hypothetical protein
LRPFQWAERDGGRERYRGRGERERERGGGGGRELILAATPSRRQHMRFYGDE